MNAHQPPLSRRSPPVHALHPGDVACGGRGERMETLLGSCVAVILTDPRRTVGAMCHIVHSGPPTASVHRGSEHGPEALQSMDRLLVARGIQPQLCEAYVYGGGNMFPDLYRGPNVGAANADWVLRALAERGVRVVHDDLGGCCYRRVHWTVGGGEPRVRCVPV